MDIRDHASARDEARDIEGRHGAIIADALLT